MRTVEPPTEWIAGTRVGVAWFVAGLSLTAIAVALLAYSVGLPHSSNSPFVYAMVLVIAVSLTQIGVSLAVPINLGVGWSPIFLTVRFPLRTVRYPIDQLSWGSLRSVQVGRDRGLLTERVVLTHRQAERLAVLLGRGAS